ncbi:MAG: epimerase [Bacteroidia bacterium]|nr:epimerase [Bacteroidia bacterium]
MNKLKVILTGATGMVGEGVLYECLNHPEVEKVLVITRKPTGYSHPKLQEIIHPDFSDFSALSHDVAGYNACYFCLGVTSMGKKEPEYARLTYDLTIDFAKVLASQNPDMTFCYISGAGTDSTEKGRVMWARVKGKTENDLMKLPFKKAYNFRPAGIIPFLPLRPSMTFYKSLKYIGWLFPIMALLTPNLIITLKDLAAALINASLIGYSKPILEVKDMKILANTSS